MDRDEELLRAFVERGDRGALGELVERHRAEAYDLARRVVRDPHLAEDATQEAFVRIIRSAGSWRGDGTVRGWLFRIVVNAARDLWKRADREARLARAAAAVGLPGPSGERSPEAAALRAEVRSAVAELPEEFQLPIVLHFFRGLSHAEVAEALECPVGTVASRIGRGKERLRQVLGGATAVVATWESALAEPEPAPEVSEALRARLDALVEQAAPAAAGVAAAGAGVAARGFLGKLAAALGVAAIVSGVAVWQGTGRPRVERVPGSSAAPETEARDRGPAGVSPRSTEEPGPARRERVTGAAEARVRIVPSQARPAPVRAPDLRSEDESGEPGVGAVRLRVVDPSGVPLAAARVALGAYPADFEEPSAPEAGRRSARGIADADGRARLVLPFPGLQDEEVVSARIRAAGFAPRTLWDVRVSAGFERDLGDVSLSPGRAIRGRVTRGGAPVEAARVWSRLQIVGRTETYADPLAPAGWFPQHSVATDREGSFVLPHEPAGDLLITAAVGAEQPEILLLPAGQEGPVAIAIGPRCPLRGRVRSDDPLPPLRAWLGSRWVAVGPDGSFEFPGVRPGRVRFTVSELPSGPIRFWEQVDPVAGPGGEPVEVRLRDRGRPERMGLDPQPDAGKGKDLEEGFELDGSYGSVVAEALDAASGRAVTKFCIHLEQQARPEAPDETLFVHREDVADGRLIFSGLPVGRYAISARARGRPETRAAVEIRTNEESKVQLALARGGSTLQGVVRRRGDGAPIGGVRVMPSAEKDAAGNGYPRPLRSAVLSGPDGSFAIPFLPAGPVPLWADGAESGYVPAFLADADPSAGPVEILLDPAATITGVLRDSAGAPASGLYVVATADGSEAKPWDGILTDEEGRFRFEGLRPGSYRVRGRKDDPALRGMGVARKEQALAAGIPPVSVRVGPTETAEIELRMPAHASAGR